MLEIMSATAVNGKRIERLAIPSKRSGRIDAKGLVLMPALIDPHVHLRTPGLEHKEDWITGARAAIAGGITTVFDMPNTIPPTTTAEALDEKKKRIDGQLAIAHIPLHYGLYLGVDKTQFHQIPLCKKGVVGLKIFMGSSTGGLVIDDDISLERAFQIGADNELVVAVHAEDEELIRKRKALFSSETDPKIHSVIRSPEVAYRATEKAIFLARKYRTRLYLLHIGTKGEVELIRKSKQQGALIFAETTPHHLFLTEKDYARLGTKAQMNPPLRKEEDVDALWEGILDGTIDTIGSDHAPHTLQEKGLPYGEAPSGIPGLETTLPLLLNSGRLSLMQIEVLMRKNPAAIFGYRAPEDWILIDPEMERLIERSSLKTKCGWSPYEGWTLKGWPIYTILRGEVYDNR